ncbi:MAG TPA: helix-turn-helix transcriptional regulator [Flavobacteriaceae bacterium]|nr:helix-turn-helix transcriptional regulator [Flavobacteriaceae bacterium]
MRKERLIAKRLERKIPQRKLADLMHMEQSTYSRRESGETKIPNSEWEKLAELLDCKVEDIYEPDELSQVKIDNRNANFNDSSGNNNNYYNLPKSVLDNLQDYIALLKKENQRLKKEKS